MAKKRGNCEARCAALSGKAAPDGFPLDVLLAIEKNCCKFPDLGWA